MKPFGIISDTHNHAWSSFASTDEDGVNSRLRLILNEFERCASEVVARGGDTVVHTGDLFHVRGSVSPSVLNPTVDCLHKIMTEIGIKNFYIVAGNHDLEFKNTTALGNAASVLSRIEGVKVINETCAESLPDGNNFVFVPWFESVSALKEELLSLKTTKNHYIFLHAPIDGVIAGLPDHGLTGGFIETLNYKCLFSGHYHHHKQVARNAYSVGAIAHHTWSDVGSKAGFLIVTDDAVEWRKSHCPEFVDVTHAVLAELADPSILVDQCYVRVKLAKATAEEVSGFKKLMSDSGALGCVVHHVPDSKVTRRETHSVKAGESIEASITEWMSKKYEGSPLLADSIRECLSIVSETV